MDKSSPIVLCDFVKDNKYDLSTFIKRCGDVTWIETVLKLLNVTDTTINQFRSDYNQAMNILKEDLMSFKILVNKSGVHELSYCEYLAIKMMRKQALKEVIPNYIQIID